MSDVFLLENETSKYLYNTYAKDMPIIDYHCHVDPQEIVENKPYRNLYEAWLERDHYKWEAMRWYGVEEDYITGEADDFLKFKAYASILPYCIGNPLHHWSHLELYRYFGFNGHLTEDNAKEVWDFVNEKLSFMKARQFLTQTKVECICTTDDPIDDLKWHRKAKADGTVGFEMLPTFRPDKIFSIGDSSWCKYIEKFSDVYKTSIKTFTDLLNALKKRLDYFENLGCKISDHGFERIDYKLVSFKVANNIFSKALKNEEITEEEKLNFSSYLMEYLCMEYTKRNWVMQLHFGVIRNVNLNYFQSIGEDAGSDCMSGETGLDSLTKFLSAMDAAKSLPKTILYSINPIDNAALATIATCFQNSEAKGKIQHGSAWWFNDSYVGMREHLDRLSSIGCLGSFIGMLTDSRSVMSYTRHDYFRRILCSWIGEQVEKGFYPNDEKYLGNIIQDICFNNAKNYLNIS